MGLSKMMTRIVVIGTIKEINAIETPFTMTKGVVDVGNNNNVRFTIFNSSPNAQNPHTKATDFAEQFKVGDKVYITGQDNRSYSEAKDQYYEDVNVWDFRAADDGEQPRWVFVYIGDVKDIDENNQLILSFINYKNDEMIFPIDVSKVKAPEGFEQGARVKVKGEIFSGFEEDFYGDGQFVTKRTAASIEVLNSAEEVAEVDLDDSPEGELWS